MTQRTDAEAILSRTHQLTDTDLKNLERIVGESQNTPPDGVRDGSMNEESWISLRDAVDYLTKAKQAINKFMRML